MSGFISPTCKAPQFPLKRRAVAVADKKTGESEAVRVRANGTGNAGDRRAKLLLGANREAIAIERAIRIGKMFYPPSNDLLETLSTPGNLGVLLFFGAVIKIAMSYGVPADGDERVAREGR
jgi:hypothetical protein